MGKINYVVEGYGKDTEIIDSFTGCLRILGENSIEKEFISSYNVIDETNKDSSQYSFWKGALGVALFGGIGGAVAGIGGKNKQYKEYLISIEWKDGEKSLILIDDEYYKIFMKSMF